MAGETIEATITAIGAAGDGVTETQEGRLYVPFTVPGDRLRVRLGEKRGGGFAAETVERLADGPARQVPPCRHFGSCGGCALQHLDATAYADFKRGLVFEALAHSGLANASVESLVRIPPAVRRRARFAALAGRDRPGLGFRERRSSRIVAISECPVLAPGIVALLPSLTRLFGEIRQFRGTAEAMVTALVDGIDLMIAAKGEPSRVLRERLAAFADEADLSRLSWHGKGGAEPIVERRPARATFGGVAVDLPVEGFLQPSAEGEAAVAAEILVALSPLAASGGRIADLYCGCGALTFPLAAAGGRMVAADGDDLAVAAVERAARHAGLGERVEAITRDLVRRPLDAAALRSFDAVLIVTRRNLYNTLIYFNKIRFHETLNILIKTLTGSTRRSAAPSADRNREVGLVRRP